MILIANRNFAVLSLLALASLATSCGLRTSGDDVAATVDGEKIYRADVEKYFQSQTAGSPPPSDAEATNLRLSILHQLIENEILMHRAAKLGLLATDEDVEHRLNEIKSPYTPEVFTQQLSERKMTLDDLRRSIRRELTAEKVVHKEITSKINVTPSDIAEYYNQHKAEFNIIEPRYHLAHILVTTSAGPQGGGSGNKARNEAEARKKIEVAMTRLKAGEDFSALAMTYSEDGSAANGGDVGFEPESALKQTDSVTRDSVMKLKPGQYTAIIPWLANPVSKQITGFQIVKLLALEPAGERELSDPRVEQEIRSKLQDHREQLLKQAYYEVMHDQARIENYYAQHLLESTGSGR